MMGCGPASGQTGNDRPAGEPVQDIPGEEPLQQVDEEGRRELGVALLLAHLAQPALLGPGRGRGERARSLLSAGLAP